MEINPELQQLGRAMRAGKLRPLTEQQTKWVEWHKSRFEPALLGAKSGFEDAKVKHLAVIQMLETIVKFVDLAAHGVGFGTFEDGVLKVKLSVFEAGGNVGKAIAKAEVRAGDETAEFMTRLLEPYQGPDGLPEGITFVAERYANSAPWVPEDRLQQYDFDYYVVIPFPE